MNLNNQCVILAGGLATRLRPITENIPKSMVRIGNKPFLEYQVELLRNMGVVDLILCVGHKSDMIVEYFGDGSNLGVKINYSHEDTLLGTGGALRNAGNMLKDRFFVLYGDAYLDVDYRDIADYFNRMRYPALLTVYKNEGQFDTSNVSFLDEECVLYDKHNPSENMRFIDYGLSIMTKKIIEQYIASDMFYDLADCYNALSLKNDLLGYEVKERFYEIGSKFGLQEFKEFIRRQR
jgi:NDP-sugar pyrophosphorylase family protein